MPVRSACTRPARKSDGFSCAPSYSRMRDESGPRPTREAVMTTDSPQQRETVLTAQPARELGWVGLPPACLDRRGFSCTVFRLRELAGCYPRFRPVRSAVRFRAPLSLPAGALFPQVAIVLTYGRALPPTSPPVSRAHCSQPSSVAARVCSVGPKTRPWGGRRAQLRAASTLRAMALA